MIRWWTWCAYSEGGGAGGYATWQRWDDRWVVPVYGLLVLRQGEPWQLPEDQMLRQEELQTHRHMHRRARLRL